MWGGALGPNGFGLRQKIRGEGAAPTVRASGHRVCCGRPALGPKDWWAVAGRFGAGAPLPRLEPAALQVVQWEARHRAECLALSLFP